MRKVLIVGGGASGLLVAINLLRKSDDCEVTIVEPNERLGLGVAYSTLDPEHLLNVPA
ncbi:MAG: FAD-dependent oxidoreductase, partial [Actinobacteria bacterium]|nr:FAD-dependent oxidoreductase [Actinomycetota bacterium]